METGSKDCHIQLGERALKSFSEQEHGRAAVRNHAAQLLDYCQLAIVKQMTGRNRAAQLAIVKQMSRH